jgi:hypothetical protein
VIKCRLANAQGLPDPDAARLVISEALTDLAGRIADQMQHHANATPRHATPRHATPRHGCHMTFATGW